MKKFSLFILIYLVLWIASLFIIFNTQKEMTLYYYSIYTLFGGLIGLILMISIRKLTIISNTNSAKLPQKIGAFLWIIISLIMVTFVIVYALLY